jgi:hypothetical protein
MVLGNGSGQITIECYLYVTGTIYNANGSIVTSGQNSSADQGSEIQGTNEFMMPASINESNSTTDSGDNNFSIAQNDNEFDDEINVENNTTVNESDQEETLFSYTPPKRILDSNINKKQRALSGESFDAIDLRISKIDQSILGLNNKLGLLDDRVTTLEQSFTQQVIAMEDGFAMSAALAARASPRTMGWSMTYGMGNYASSNALSIGLIYVGEEHVFSVGYAEADGSEKSMFNLGGAIPLKNIFRK